MKVFISNEPLNCNDSYFFVYYSKDENSKCISIYYINPSKKTTKELFSIGASYVRIKERCPFDKSLRYKRLCAFKLFNIFSNTKHISYKDMFSLIKKVRNSLINLI